LEEEEQKEENNLEEEGEFEQPHSPKYNHNSH
jgi:hypothetical protein